MNRRGLVGGFLVIVCLAILLGVWSQANQLASLRAEQRQLLAQMAGREGSAGSAVTAEALGTGSETPQPRLVATPELLRLRSEVTRLTERRNELAGARAENERLRAQVASRGTNGPSGLKLPPGYLRKREARLVGYSTPEDTLQSLLWALQNHNLTNLLQAFTADKAEELQAELTQSNRSAEDYFSDATAVPGMAIKTRKQLPDGAVELQVEMVPDLRPAPIRMRQVDGQWKITAPF